jgi:putative drug exporter of the RND superfamily
MQTMVSAVTRVGEVIASAAGVVIVAFVALLLPSVVAPWYLIASVGLGFGATLGVSVLVFQHLRGQAGLVFLLPVYMYLFVVALGTDYNILMIARCASRPPRAWSRGRPRPSPSGTPGRRSARPG